MAGKKLGLFMNNLAKKTSYYLSQKSSKKISKQYIGMLPKSQLNKLKKYYDLDKGSSYLIQTSIREKLITEVDD